jgi:hypothetical protein
VGVGGQYRSFSPGEIIARGQAVRITGLGLVTVGLLLCATAMSYPSIKGNQVKAAHQDAFTRAITNCKVLPSDQSVQQGYYYAQMLDPSQKWVDSKTGKPVFEGALLQPVATKSICALDGSFGEIGASGVAQNIRSVSGEEMRAALKKRFGGEVTFIDMATMSRRFLPNFDQRNKQKSKPKTGMEIKA